jgi:hypothetical protein
MRRNRSALRGAATKTSVGQRENPPELSPSPSWAFGRGPAAPLPLPQRRSYPDDFLHGHLGLLFHFPSAFDFSQGTKELRGISEEPTVLHSLKVRINCAANDPFTTHEVLAEMHGTPLRGKRVVVQRYCETNRELQAALESEGADVIEIVTYRWGLPEDTAPLLRLIRALDRDEIDLVAFTSASQASNLFTVAQNDGKEASLKQSLGRTLVASIGPVCSVALRKFAVRIDIEAKPPKLGPFIEAINAALSDKRPLGKL